MKFEIKVTGNSSEKYDAMSLAEEMGHSVGQMLNCDISHGEYQANMATLLKVFGRGVADNCGGVHKIALLPDGVVYSCECTPEAVGDYCNFFREVGKRFMPMVPMAKALYGQFDVFTKDFGERMEALTKKYTRESNFGYILVDKTEALGVCGAMLMANDGVSVRACWPINAGNEDYPCILGEAAEKAIDDGTITWLSVDEKPVTDHIVAERLIREILEDQYRSHSRMAVRIVHDRGHDAENPKVTVVQIEITPDGKRFALRTATLAGEPICPYDLQTAIDELDIPEGSTFARNDEHLPSVWESVYADAKASCGSKLNAQAIERTYNNVRPGYKKVVSSAYGQVGKR